LRRIVGSTCHVDQKEAVEVRAMRDVDQGNEMRREEERRRDKRRQEE
jgi:hypothetical protein